MNNFFKNLGVGQESLIRKWLDEHGIEKYTINNDLTIDVDDNISLDEYSERKFPDYIQFGKVGGCFSITETQLTSLVGSPKECETFQCGWNKKLKSLIGAPKKCKEFNCVECDILENLDGSPTICETFICWGCNKLKNLKGAPHICNSFNCETCFKLTSLEGAPQVCKDTFDCSFCPSLMDLKGITPKTELIYCNNCGTKFTRECVKKLCNFERIVL